MFYRKTNQNIRIRPKNSNELFMDIYSDRVDVFASCYLEERMVERFIYDNLQNIEIWQSIELENEQNSNRKTKCRKRISAYEQYKVCKESYIDRPENAYNSNDRFAISVKQIIELYTSDEKFKQVLNSGNFIYVDGKLCLNNAKYIDKQFSKIGLTEYALANKDECCLSFSMITTKQLDDASDLIVKSNINDKVSKAEELAENMSKYPSGLAETIKQMINDRNITLRELGMESFLQERTISRIINGNTEPTLQTLLGLCCGLKLEVPQIELLIGKSGRFLRDDVAQDVAYKLMLPYCSLTSLEEINLVLFKNNFELWGSKTEIKQYSTYFSDY